MTVLMWSHYALISFILEAAYVREGHYHYNTYSLQSIALFVFCVEFIVHELYSASGVSNCTHSQLTVFFPIVPSLCFYIKSVKVTMDNYCNTS